MLRTNASTQTPLLHSRPPLHTDPRSPLTTSSAVILSELRKAERRILSMLGVFSRKGEEVKKRAGAGKSGSTNGDTNPTNASVGNRGVANEGTVGKDKGGEEFDDGSKPRLLRELLPIHLLDLHFANGGGRGLSSSSSSSTSDSSDLDDNDDEESDSGSLCSTSRRRHNGADRVGERHRHTSPLRSRVAPRKVRRLPTPITPSANLTAKGGSTDMSGPSYFSGASTFEADAYACDDAVLRSFAAIKVAQSFQQCERAIAEQLEFMRIISEEQALAAAGNARTAAQKEFAMFGGRGALSIVKESRRSDEEAEEVATPTNRYQQLATSGKSAYNGHGGGETDARNVKTTPPSTPTPPPERESRMVVVSGAYATTPLIVLSADENHNSRSDSAHFRTTRRESGTHEIATTKATFTTSTSSRRGSSSTAVPIVTTMTTASGAGGDNAVGQPIDAKPMMQMRGPDEDYSQRANNSYQAASRMTAVEHAWGQLAALSTTSSSRAPPPSEEGYTSISVSQHHNDAQHKSETENRIYLSSGGESVSEKVFEKGAHRGQVFVPPLPNATATAAGIVSSMPPVVGPDLHQGDPSYYTSRSVSAVTSVSGATNSAVMISPAASLSVSGTNLARVAESSAGDGLGGQGSIRARGPHGSEGVGAVGLGAQQRYRQEGERTLGANSSSDRDPRLSPPPTNHNGSRHVYGHLADGSAGGVRILGSGHHSTNTNPNSVQVQGGDRPRETYPLRDEGTPTSRSSAVIALQTPPVPMVTSHRARNYMAHLKRVLSAADTVGDDDSVFF